ncbi:hypothetical protein F3Y22_tig00110279pilonHSYRG00059 [Hibiscus syriacus]|uniref:Uncharacterized protein n=1 Tax=Hibiscus syriacus TaxID=106335 RepID=A0A6A3B8L6_HIBSY|nr:hypothetical protein F3Y22_tig00110279pilonHSYRG00059 [Hibiscus syriacus]
MATPTTATATRETRGRQKIQIKKLKNEASVSHPSVDAILDRYLSENPLEDADTDIVPCFEEFNEECREASEKLEVEKEQTKETYCYCNGGAEE